MSDPSRTDVAAVQAQAAAEERAAILQIIEAAMRQLAHGHGANGQQVLQHVVEEIERRGRSPA